MNLDSIKSRRLRYIERLRRYHPGTTWSYDAKRGIYRQLESGRTVQPRIGIDCEHAHLYWMDTNESAEL